MRFVENISTFILQRRFVLIKSQNETRDIEISN